MLSSGSPYPISTTSAPEHLVKAGTIGMEPPSKINPHFRPVTSEVAFEANSTALVSGDVRKAFPPPGWVVMLRLKPGGSFD